MQITNQEPNDWKRQTEIMNYSTYTCCGCSTKQWIHPGGIGSQLLGQILCRNCHRPACDNCLFDSIRTEHVSQALVHIPKLENDHTFYGYICCACGNSWKLELVRDTHSILRNIIHKPGNKRAKVGTQLFWTIASRSASYQPVGTHTASDASRSNSWPRSQSPRSRRGRRIFWCRAVCRTMRQPTPLRHHL